MPAPGAKAPGYVYKALQAIHPGRQVILAWPRGVASGAQPVSERSQPSFLDGGGAAELARQASDLVNSPGALLHEPNNTQSLPLKSK